MTFLTKTLGMVVASASLLGAITWSADDKDSQACQCQSQIELDTRLPMSHPVNRCANQTQELNWWSWLGGHSNAGQFHYLDLLELLSRFSDDNSNTRPNP